MSRRESRNSSGGRQTSALEEFENFKKKYLLVNKHIAKLNSSLNVRIDELLAQITALNIDNLRLRASEMSLARKLENEQDRTRRLYRETESASQLLVSQVNSMKVMFGLDKPPVQSILRDYNSNSRQTATRQPHPPPSCRIARAPEVEVIMEASEDDRTPAKAASHRQSPSPTPGPATPLGRRRSTGSTPHSTPASNYFSPSSGNSTHSTTTQGRSSDEGRRSSAPMSMDITNGSSPLTPCHSISVANQSALVSPSPAPNAPAEQVAASPLSDQRKAAQVETAGDAGSIRNAVDAEPTPPFNVPQLNLTGLKRVARTRPSGLLTEESTEVVHPPVSVSIPSTSDSGNGAPAYPTPLSPEPAPTTPPRVSSIRLPGSTSPATPTRTLPMSPSLSANPALSPPPARKLSLTRRQLDFGIPDPEETESEDLGTEINTTEQEADGLFGFQSDSVGKRAIKRNGLEDDDRDDAIILSAANRTNGVRVRRQEKRRDTGTVLTGLSLREKDSREGLLKERGSKESLRDVTNEGTSSSVVGSQPLDAKDATSPIQKVHNGYPMTTTSSGKSHFTSGTVAGIAAKLERLSSVTRPKPLTTPTPIPLPSSDRDIKIPLPEEEQTDEAASAEAAATAELGRRNSGRQRKSVNYKEPSLNTKMRKPDPNPTPIAPSSAPVSSSSSAGGSSAAVTPTATTNTASKPPKRKKGSISLIGEMTSGGRGTLSSASTSSLYLATTDAESRKSKLDLLEPISGSGDVPRQQNQKRTSRLWEKYIDLSDEEDENAGNGNKDSPTVQQAEPGGSYLSSETGSRYSFAGLTSLRGTSILAKGPNPIVASAAPNPVVRSIASLRITPGAARERVRDEIMGGATSRREREKEREREREREREQEGERGTNGIAI